MSDKPHLVLRTVREGQVTIYGRRYAPEQRHLAYDFPEAVAGSLPWMFWHEVHP